MMRERGRQLEQQGLELCRRYESTGQPDHLVRGIALLIDAMKHADGTGQQVIICGNLGTALSRYFELTSSDAALDDSITLLSAAVTSGLLGGEDLMAWTHGLRHSLRDGTARPGSPPTSTRRSRSPGSCAACRRRSALRPISGPPGCRSPPKTGRREPGSGCGRMTPPRRPGTPSPTSTQPWSCAARSSTSLPRTIPTLPACCPIWVRR
jgi:hypothetical protein